MGKPELYLIDAPGENFPTRRWSHTSKRCPNGKLLSTHMSCYFICALQQTNRGRTKSTERTTAKEHVPCTTDSITPPHALVVYKTSFPLLLSHLRSMGHGKVNDVHVGATEI